MNSSRRLMFPWLLFVCYWITIYGRPKCGEHMFRCANGEGCYYNFQKCSGMFDCADHSDEDEIMCRNDDCPLSYQLKCADNRTCISNPDICDLVEDCPDGSDEINCKERSCPPGFSKCANGIECVGTEYFCDGEYECSDNSDEHGCENRPCLEDYMKCKDGKQCVLKTAFCELYHYEDCADLSDEDPEFCRDFTCPSLSTKCSDGITCTHLSPLDCSEEFF